MIKIDSSWNCATTACSSDSQRILRIRLKSDESAGSPAVCAAIAVDTSGSMDGEKLENARKACRVMVETLRPSDRVSLAYFSNDVSEMINNSTAAKAKSEIEDIVNRMVAQGITRTDLALLWLTNVLDTNESGVRHAFLITDGKPTDTRGRALKEMEPLLRQARALAQHKCTLHAVGLGDAANFRTDLLSKLASETCGSFVFAQDPATLAEAMKERINTTQVAGSNDVVVNVRCPNHRVNVLSCCRLRPEFAALELSDADGRLRIGSVPKDQTVDLLLEVQIAKLMLGGVAGSQIVIQMTADDGDGNPTSHNVETEYTNTTTGLLTFDDDVERDRLLWETNLNTEKVMCAGSDEDKVDQLQDLATNAANAGIDNVASLANKTIHNAQMTGIIDPNDLTRLLEEARRGR